MNKTYKIALFFALSLSSSFAQKERSTNNIPTSNLILLETKTQNERIEFLLEVAFAYMNEEDFAAAINAFDRILAIDPHHLQSRYIIAHLYINTKQYEKARDLLLTLTHEFPNDFKLWNNLAWLYATAEDSKIRDGKKAVQYAQEALTLAPNDHHVWSTLSEAHYIAGNYEKAYRAITHMAILATRYANDVTKESIDDYNKQIQKCKRAMDTDSAMKDRNKK